MGLDRRSFLKLLGVAAASPVVLADLPPTKVTTGPPRQFSSVAPPITPRGTSRLYDIWTAQLLDKNGPVLDAKKVAVRLIDNSMLVADDVTWHAVTTPPIVGVRVSTPHSSLLEIPFDRSYVSVNGDFTVKGIAVALGG